MKSDSQILATNSEKKKKKIIYKKNYNGAKLNLVAAGGEILSHVT